MVGFSLIFQYYLQQFADLAAYLRASGVDCHFCAGGHYPSLRYDETLNAVPELDSIVCGEGELTLPELMWCLAEEQDWRQVTGIAYRTGHGCVTTPQRALITDVDDLPYPIRPFEEVPILGKKASFVMASRGCVRNCSFCSIRQFYSQARGKRVRVRNPAKVVEEMRVLHKERGTSIFLFQDDDFPLWGKFGRRWVDEFIKALHAQNLIGRIIWKISCRADEVDSQLFARMRDAGLYMVYLGLESGNEIGLRTLNKGLTPDHGLRAVAILRELKLCLGYGFMMFDPSSTVQSVRQNASFLRQVAGGEAAAHFCRMVPYAGTPIEAELARDGRSQGDPTDPQYDFLDPQTTELFERLHGLTQWWIHDPGGVVNQVT